MATPAENAEEQRLWGAVGQNAQDFASWTALLQLVEREASGDIDKTRRAFDGFLAEFPLCYGYWKKYADTELARSGDVDRVVAIYERGVAGIPNSVDLWVHYCTFLQQHRDADAVRSAFERGAAAAGADFLSHPFWEHYVAFEADAAPRVAAIYRRIVALPIQKLPEFYARFKEWAAPRPAADLLPPDELVALEAEGAVKAQEGGAPFDQQAFLRERAMAVYEGLFTAATVEAEARRELEAGIRRPYFHVKELDDAQLANWRKYLDFAIARGKDDDTVVLFERCLVAAASYAEFWLRYATWFEDRGEVAAARAVYERCTGVFLKTRPAVHLAHAAFEEAHGNIDAARAIHRGIAERVAPQLVEGVLAYANFERRQGSPAATVTAVYDAFCAALGEPSSDTRDTYAYVAAHHARYLARSGGDARAVFAAAMTKVPHHKTLLLAAVAFEIEQGGAEMVSRVDALYDGGCAAESGFSAAERRELWLHRLDFLHDHAPTVAAARTAHAAFAASLPDAARSSGESRKRALDGGDEPAGKQARPAEEEQQQQYQPQQQPQQQQPQQQQAYDPAVAAQWAQWQQQQQQQQQPYPAAAQPQ